MTIQKAIELLTQLEVKHGNIEIFFDCQYCGKSTRPDVIVPMIVVTGKVK